MSSKTKRIITDTGLVIEGEENTHGNCNHQIIVLQCPNCGEEIEKTIKCPFCGELMRVVSVIDGNAVARPVEPDIVTNEEEEEFGPILPEDEDAPQGLVDLGE
ncbi:hypothetical protein JW962_01310 [Candidatus Dojkabacteria bacterium]|nr:hypothetical protein [Candidatus Dojkabacteria bacterium]